MDSKWMDHDEDYEPAKPKPRSKQRPLPKAAKPDNIDARLAAIRQQAVATFQASRR